MQSLFEPLTHGPEKPAGDPANGMGELEEDPHCDDAADRAQDDGLVQSHKGAECTAIIDDRL